jgi:hypothetical protein
MAKDAVRRELAQRAKPREEVIRKAYAPFLS